jgi:hypothetical protein
VAFTVKLPDSANVYGHAADPDASVILAQGVVVLPEGSVTWKAIAPCGVLAPELDDVTVAVNVAV